MMQFNVLYGHPTDAAAFEAYYASTHMPLAGRVLGPHVQAVCTTRCMPDQNGARPAYYENWGRLIRGWPRPAAQSVLLVPCL